MLAVADDPTAMHQLADLHDTPFMYEGNGLIPVGVFRTTRAGVVARTGAAVITSIPIIVATADPVAITRGLELSTGPRSTIRGPATQGTSLPSKIDVGPSPPRTVVRPLPAPGAWHALEHLDVPACGLMAHPATSGTPDPSDGYMPRTSGTC